MQEILAQTLPLVALAFLASAMFSVGLDLTARQIVEPLKNRRLVGAALLANVVLVPLLALAIVRLVPMDHALAIGIVVYALAAGTEGGPKFVQLAKGNAGFAVGLLALLLSITVVCMPMALSLAVPDAHVDRGSLLVKLFMAVVVPIGAGLVIRATRAGLADRLERVHAPGRPGAARRLLPAGDRRQLRGHAGVAVGRAARRRCCISRWRSQSAYLLGGPRQENRRALAIMTFVRNAPISMTTASQVFPARARACWSWSR